MFIIDSCDSTLFQNILLGFSDNPIKTLSSKWYKINYVISKQIQSLKNLISIQNSFFSFLFPILEFDKHITRRIEALDTQISLNLMRNIFEDKIGIRRHKVYSNLMD